jgi:hypothetical protein
MWPFDNKNKSKVTEPKKIVESVICIPGTWEDWDKFKLSLISSSEMKYMAIGNILMDVNRKKNFAIEFCDYDPKMEKSFATAGKATRMTEHALVEIGNHKNVIYISTQTGNLEDVESIAFAAAAILKAGGLGIKIETAGKAFENERWFKLLETFDEANLYEMFVLDSILDENGTVFSCGMHNLGLKDTIISGQDFQDAVGLISTFGCYQIIDKPTIHNNQTFSVDTNSPKFRIIDEQNKPYKNQDLFDNPYGMWRLTKA